VRRTESIQGGRTAAIELAVIEADEVLALEVDVAEVKKGEEVTVKVKTSVSSAMVMRAVGL
jgi:hypothetical protein